MIKRVLYRFFAVYLGLFSVASQFLGGLILFPGFSFPALGTVWPMRPITEFIGSHVFGVTNFAVYGTSADTAFHWVLLSWLVVVAAVAAVMTTFVGSNFSRTDDWVRTFLRFALAAQMFYFGMAKVIPAQFPPPNLVTLVKPLGDLAPDDLLWDFIGSSLTYQIFTGVAEVAAGVLLVVPKTALIGAIIAFADMLQVFVLNMSYDIGLKQTSSHLMFIALFLLWPDLKRLGAALVARPEGRAGTWDRGRLLWVQVAFGVYLLAMFARLSILSYQNPGGAGAPKSPLYGIWNVERMSMDGEFRAPILNDYDRRWRRVIFDAPNLVVFERTDDSFLHYDAAIDTERHQIALRKQSRVWSATIAYDRRGDDAMVIDGEIDGHNVHAELQRVGMDTFRLTNGTFRWVRPPG